MAIQDTTEQYYKIDFENCSVRGDNVFVRYYIYDSSNTRQNEKDRENYINEFFIQLNNYIDNTKENLNLVLTEDNITTDEELENSEFFPQILEIETLDYVASKLPFLIRRINNFDTGYIIPDNILSILKSFGFSEEWVNNPIVFYDGGIVNCGIYDGEIVDYKLFYDRLKRIINSNVIDV